MIDHIWLCSSVKCVVVLEVLQRAQEIDFLILAAAMLKQQDEEMPPMKIRNYGYVTSQRFCMDRKGLHPHGQHY